MKQDRLGHMLRRMTPPVDETGAWESIQSRLAPGTSVRRPAVPRRRRSALRLISYGLATVLVLAGVGFGVNVLVQALMSDPVVHIGGGPMSPGSNPGGTATAASDSDYVTVLDPYHNESLDAPNYLSPEKITLAQGLSLPEFPESVPARKLKSDALPETDLDLVPNAIHGGLYQWSDYTEEPAGAGVVLGSQEVAIKAAKAFLVEHGLWSEEYGEPSAAVGSIQLDGSDRYTTSWLVDFPGETTVAGMERYVAVRVGHENRVVGISLSIPQLETLEDKYVRLRPVQEVLTDLEAWSSGYPSDDMQNQVNNGPVDVKVVGVSLAYEDPGVGDEPVAVPVYLFDVGVVSADGLTSAEGTWMVVAAADVEGLHSDAEQTGKLTVYLRTDPDPTSDQVATLREQIMTWEEVKTVVVVSKEGALARLKQSYKDSDVLDDLAGNPLPASLEISLHDPQTADTVAARFDGDPLVQEVVTTSDAKPGP